MKAAVRQLLDSRPTTLPKPRERADPRRSAALRELDTRVQHVLSTFADDAERGILKLYFEGGSMHESSGVLDRTRRLLRQRGLYTTAEQHLRELVQDFEQRYSDRFPCEAAG